MHVQVYVCVCECFGESMSVCLGESVCASVCECECLGESVSV